MHLSAVLLINLDLQTVAFRTRGQKRQEAHGCVAWITHLPLLPCTSQWHPSIFNYWKVFNLVWVRAEYDGCEGLPVLLWVCFLTKDVTDVGGNSKIITSTASRSWCWGSSRGGGWTGKGGKTAGELLSENQPCKKIQFLRKLHFKACSIHVMCGKSCPSEKECSFVILKIMESWKSKLSQEINLVILLGDTGDKSVCLQAGVLCGITSPQILVKALNLEE